MNFLISKKRLIVFYFLIYTATSCVSVKTYNAKLNELHSVNELIKDIDFAQRKLQKLHPNLYLYISKSDLDSKFDSLKSTIASPMTSNDFYFKLSPVISEIKQGHNRLFPPTPKLTKKENKQVKKNGLTPISKLGFEILDNKIYITKNLLGDTTLKPGTELVSVNSIKPNDLFLKYNKTFSSDGFNQTFQDNYLKREFPRFYYLENGLADSVLCELKYKDSIRTVYLKYKPPVKNSIKNIKAKKAESDSMTLKKQTIKKQLPKTDVNKPYYFKFLESDSNVAYMKIRSFSAGNQNSFYKKSFKKLNESKSNALVIDLRDNFGGKLNNVAKLYSFLADTSFIFVDKFELTSRTSFFQTNYLKGQPWGKKVVRMTIGLPSWLISMGIGMHRIKKTSDGKFLFRTGNSKLKKPSSDRFDGKVYVLINGGSFSASSILSSNLKGTERAFFAGEETGGAYNGCVAGYMPVFELPGSGLKLKFGIAQVQPFHKTNIEGRGIFPDFEINPAIDDLINGTDPVLDRVLKEIKTDSIK